jgi:hypothetical protein
MWWQQVQLQLQWRFGRLCLAILVGWATRRVQCPPLQRKANKAGVQFLRIVLQNLGTLDGAKLYLYCFWMIVRGSGVARSRVKCVGHRKHIVVTFPIPM